ncbi:LPP20 family lipoprotein [Idiomarina aquatica]|uniref:LPP20 lipoprotein n=2 Tax=Idiomarina TaxID=135575 RepID=A0AA94EG30_9GAMM|nr:LPP20 family lipoprotein [Idiomarina aquatica]RUO45218.1 hypothetical protein CWE23_04165 [Idiomarina aquatica]
MKKWLITSLFVTAGALSGCASNGGEPVSYDPCVFPDAPDHKAPGWICEQPVKDVWVQAVGFSPKKSAGPGFMKDVAAQEARNRLAQNFAQQIASEYKRYTADKTTNGENVSVDAIEQTMLSELAMNVVYSRIYRSQTSPNGGVYVLVGLNEAGYKENVDRLFNNPIDPENPELFQQFLIDNSKSKLEQVREEL